MYLTVWNASKTYGIWTDKLEGKRALYGRFILKLISKKQRADWMFLAKNTEVTGASKHSNEILGIIEDGEPLHYTRDY